MTWSDVDLDQKIVRITAKTQWSWKPKDCEERYVPIPEWLIDTLRQLNVNSSSSLLFPNELGQPEGHFFLKLETLTLRAGLNCGHCTNKRGQSCKDKPVCRRWSLHKFRRTFATMHHDSGVSARTLQAWLGHSNLETTLRYLKVEDMRSERIRSQVDKTLATVVATRLGAARLVKVISMSCPKSYDLRLATILIGTGSITETWKIKAGFVGGCSDQLIRV
jgi:integrase